MTHAGSTMFPRFFAAVLAAAALGAASCSSHPADAGSSATTALPAPIESKSAAETKVLMVLAASSGSTAKIARAMADELGARVVGPGGGIPQAGDFTLVGFGSGIFSGEHHASLLALADELPPTRHGKAFIFSTCGLPARLASPETLADYVFKNHAALRSKLLAKGYEIVGEFGCPGFNDNKFLKLIGGLNRGRPNAEDLDRARSFARQLVQLLEARE